MRAAVTLQNRVDPYGELHAAPARGAWTGNRGVLHDDSRRIVARWRNKRWICCALRFKDRHRVVMTPRRWTELFFLDEATAYAAGHRPCAECRREAYVAFRAAWAAANRVESPSAVAIDEVLHAERLGPKPRARFDALPDGTMVEIGGEPHLVRGGRALPWRFEGYDTPRSAGGIVLVLTPASIVRAFAHGLKVQM